MRRKRLGQVLIGVLISEFLTFNARAAATAILFESPPQYTTVLSGLEYANLRITNQPWSIHIARLDRTAKGFDLVTTHGKGRIQGLAGLSQQVAAFPPDLGRPLAAVNGDFFHISPGPYQGDPEGLQIINGELISAPSDKSFWSDTKGKVHIGVVHPEQKVTWPSGTTSRLGLNEPPRANGATLFTPAFGRTTAATNLTELVLEPTGIGPWLPLRVDKAYRGRVVQIRPEGNTALSSNRVVLTVTGTATTNLATLKRGDIVTFTTDTSADLSKATVGLGGGPVLVQNGKEQPWPSKKGALDQVQPRHPRTAVGFNERYLYLVVVDGRQKDLSIGMSFVELAALMKQIGCREALNLDGGGSATFWLDGKVMNSPSDKRERSLANALMIVQKPKSK